MSIEEKTTQRSFNVPVNIHMRHALRAAHLWRLVNQASTVIEFSSFRSSCPYGLKATSSSSSLSQDLKFTACHAWLRPRSTRAHRLLMSGSTAFLRADRPCPVWSMNTDGDTFMTPRRHQPMLHTMLARTHNLEFGTKPCPG